MDNSVIKESLKEVLKESITDEAIHDAIVDVVAYEIDYGMRNMIISIAEEVARNYAEEQIKEKVDEFIKSPVKISDGWCEEATYDSFEIFLKKEIREKLSNSWNVQRTVKKYVNERIEGVCNKISEEVAKTQVDEVVKLLCK